MMCISQSEIYPRINNPDPASTKEISELLKDATELLLEAGFLLPHTVQARMAKVLDLLNRANAHSGEVALFRGMVRQLRWAIRANLT